MQIETYEITECQAENVQPEVAEEVVDLIETLDLNGQRKLLKRDDGGKSTRIPYQEMTREEQFVFRVLCPERIAVNEYDAGPIPLRVLQIVALCNEKQWFERIEIWDRTRGTVDDPVLVGVMRDGYYERLFLLARWGKELDEMPYLLKVAWRTWRNSRLAKLREIKAEVSGAIAQLEDTEDLVEIPNRIDPPMFYA